MWAICTSWAKCDPAVRAVRLRSRSLCLERRRLERRAELVQVEVELARSDRVMVGAGPPAVEQRGHAVGARYGDLGGVAARGNVHRPVAEAGPWKTAASAPGVDQDDRSRLDDLRDEDSK